MAGILADLSNMHDWREPYTGAPPSRNQHVRNARKGHRVRITNIRTSGNRPPRECVAPGADVRREDSSRPNLFRIWLQRNCRYIYNYNPLPPLSLLANVDIQGCTSKYGALSYATPYITHRGSNGTFLCAGGKYVRPLHIAHVGGKEKFAPGNLPIFNAQCSPAIISHLEVCHMNWNIPRHLYSRSFKTLAMKTSPRRARTPTGRQNLRVGGMRTLHARRPSIGTERDSQYLQPMRLHPPPSLGTRGFLGGGISGGLATCM